MGGEHRTLGDPGSGPNPPRPRPARSSVRGSGAPPEAAPRLRLVTSWLGAFLLDGDQIVDTEAAPSDSEGRSARLRDRREGRSTPEERALIARHADQPIATRDRRLVGGLIVETDRGPGPTGVPFPVSPAALRELLFEAGGQALHDAWDPSIHVEEAVRAAADLDRVTNLLSERLGSWAGRDAGSLEAGESEPGAERLAARIADGSWAPAADLPGADPALLNARRSLARLIVETRSTHDALTRAVADALPRRAPNISALLGPELAARLISQAGGLDRLARLPSSTVQVLGAERAFFEHLRGRAPPPRHGLLFLHPQVQSSPRRLRGKIARALAGKVAIAARLDLNGAPVRPELKTAFDQRARAVKAAGTGARRSDREVNSAT